ncbi:MULTISPECIES: TIGR03751 family conjugal transfer lipoprotein [Pseudomonas]|jgi:conjugative transfer region lipoprotein (TIGR03751 family)|uniref:Conjugal transfer protein n=3 Tax=Pseudomonas putida group TaxID=136845 RepID=V9UX38_9PSED|nr:MULTISPECIES: TIGR03751 family conjugal transfer lipoprotein [Pseudomonas]AHC82396.1 conjugal transfer protein [Pseudomonas monteilii SB3078]AHC87774.1 conjugal transfer protein [Pseudomonas monteilii SB3101]MDD1997090.1 TIGR03751 family conjugal transfer lipoprotein [Pseudomonas putida]MDD2010210.1 TIGR03751 family conjugal transfer lipoprotein [Pseudomonas putida]MDS9591765.1 TIGR03751 family conjugal transfer lipoprotein [Pseudomonas sp. HTZ1]
MKAHPSRYWIWISLLLGLHLAGCSTSKEEMLPHGDHTMLDIWNGGGSVGTQQQLLEARGELRRPVQDPERLINAQSAYTRTAANEIRAQFPRLPNPDLVMYVYPHLAGTQQTPVPGYSTVFPLYEKVQYALPGERLDDL